MGLGVQFAVSILLFVLLGQWVDRKVGTGGIFTLLGALLGFGATMLSLIRDLNRDRDRDDGPKPPEPRA